MTHVRVLIFLISSFSFYNSFGQIDRIDPETAIEALFALPDGNLNYEELYERYLLLYENPVDLNTATYSDLKSLFAFSDDEIKTIISYRDSVQTIRSIYELAYIASLDQKKIQRISAFLTVQASPQLSGKQLWRSFMGQRQAYLIMRYERRLERSRGYKSSAPSFAGDPNKLYLRYRNRLDKHFSVGLTTEKDPGEAFIFDRPTYRRGMDYWSAHLMLENKGKIKRLIIGDYQLQFGQGLIFNSGLGIGKGAETINTIEKVYNGIRPYTSVIEGGFMRGVAAMYTIDTNLSLTTFYSSLRQDARLRTLSDSLFVFSNFQLTGLHRTTNEISRKKQVKEQIAGLNLLYKSRNLNQVGLLWQISSFSNQINRGFDPVNQFEFRGRQNMNISVYGNKQLNQFRAFGEMGLSQNKAFGGIIGVEGKLAPRLQTVLLARKYGRSFHSLRGSAFGENSRNINESGIYLGLKYILNSKFYTTGYYDRFFNQWLGFRTFKPSKGYDFLLRLNYIPNRKNRFYFQYRFKQKERNVQFENRLVILPGRSKRFILHLDHQASPQLSLRSKVQWSNYLINELRTTGIAFFQDVNIDFDKVRFSGRFSIFETQGGDNRQYAYERDLLYAFSIPGLSGRGVRNYLLIQYTPTRKVSFWLKLSRTTYFDRNRIGTGVDTIDGNKLTDLKFQTMIKF